MVLLYALLSLRSKHMIYSYIYEWIYTYIIVISFLFFSNLNFTFPLTFVPKDFTLISPNYNIDFILYLWSLVDKFKNCIHLWYTCFDNMYTLWMISNLINIPITSHNYPFLWLSHLRSTLSANFRYAIIYSVSNQRHHAIQYISRTYVA